MKQITLLLALIALLFSCSEESNPTTTDNETNVRFDTTMTDSGIVIDTVKFDNDNDNDEEEDQDKDNAEVLSPVTFDNLNSSDIGSGTSSTTPIENYAPYIDGMVLIPAKDNSVSMVAKDSNNTEIEVSFTYDYYMKESEVTVEEAKEVFQYAIDNDLVHVGNSNNDWDRYLNYSTEVIVAFTESYKKGYSEGNTENGILCLDGTTGSEYLSANKGNYPVTNVTWVGAMVYCNTLSVIQGLEPVYSVFFLDGRVTPDFSKNGYRVSTEAEWTYAAKAGTDTKWYWGDDASEADEYEVYNVEELPTVNSKKPNPWGLYDMLGSQNEFCSDLDYVDLENIVNRALNDPSAELKTIIKGSSIASTKIEDMKYSDSKSVAKYNNLNYTGLVANFRVVLPVK